MSYDTIIRGGTIVDGTGAPAFSGDVALKDGKIAAVGSVDGTAECEVDAAGAIVTPGFVDIHTHLDAQVGWDPLLSSCCWHGVTSVVMGNCGVSFAPVKTNDIKFLAGMMESVEDIPAEGILSALSWKWETYGDYLDELEKGSHGLNVGGMVGHCAVRIYAMGERAMQEEPADPEDIAAMCAIVDEAIGAGALGFSTSRTFMHKVPDGRPVPGTFADDNELFAIGDVLKKHGRGVFESAPAFPVKGEDISPTVDELNTLGEISRRTGRPVSFSLVASSKRPGYYKTILGLVADEVASGAQIRPQSTTRPIGMLYGLEFRTPWDEDAAWAQMAGLDLTERLECLKDEAMRRKLIAAEEGVDPKQLFLLRPNQMDYRPNLDNSLYAEAQRRGLSAVETFIELCVETEGKIVLSHPFLNDEWEAVEYMVRDPNVVLGLADAGAHVSMIMDASQPTWTLAHLTRDTGFFSLEDAIRRMTSDTADLFGIKGRGRLQVGAHADINVIDLDALEMLPPDFVRDMPDGSGRIIQKANGYRHTFVNGVEFMRDGEHTGALSGQVLRS